MNLLFDEVLNAVGGKLSGDNKILKESVSAVVRDNRDAVPGCLFAAIVGENNDGHSYIAAAAEAGAVCALGQYVPEGCALPVILVEDTVLALGALAEFYRAGFDIPIIGVTGSVGKTTSKEMLSSVLSQRFRLHKTQGNLNNNIGTPLTLFGLNETHEAAVIEMGISHFGEMAQLAKMVRPRMAYFSAIGSAHLEFLGDLDGVMRAKAEMLDYLPADGVVFVNGDDKTLQKLTCRQRIVRFGLSRGCDVTAENINNYGEGGTSLTVVCGPRRFDLRIYAFGQHLISAALGAAAVGIHMGLTDREIVRGVAEYAPVGGRSALEKAGGINIVNDCYNANPTSVCAALDSLAALPGRRLAILGDMLELGDESAEALHEEVGRYAAESGLELLITTGDLSAFTSKAAAEAEVPATRHFDSRESLIAALPKLVRSGDSVLVKASNSRQFIEIVEALRTLFSK